MKEISFRNRPVASVLFDMDGTLIDTEKIATLGWKEACEKKGVPFYHFLFDSLKGRGADSARLAFDHVYHGSLSYFEARKERTRFVSAYFSSFSIRPLPGAKDLLSYLREAGIPFAIATSSPLPYTRNALLHSGLLPYVDSLTTGESVVHGKPDPEIFLLAARKNGMVPRKTLVVEDSRYGIQAAVRGGFLPVGVPNAYPFDEKTKSDCLAVYDSLPGLLAEIRKSPEIPKKR